MNAIWFLYDSSATVAEASISNFRKKFPEFKVGLCDFSESGSSPKLIHKISPDFYEKMEFRRSGFQTWECAYGFLAFSKRMEEKFGGGTLWVRPEVVVNTIEFDFNKSISFYNDGVCLPYCGIVYFNSGVFNQILKDVSSRPINYHHKAQAETLSVVSAMRLLYSVEMLDFKKDCLNGYQNINSNLPFLDFGRPPKRASIDGRLGKMKIIREGILNA